MNLACDYIRLLLEIHREVDESIDQSTNKVEIQRKITIHSTFLLQVGGLNRLLEHYQWADESTGEPFNEPTNQVDARHIATDQLNLNTTKFNYTK